MNISPEVAKVVHDLSVAALSILVPALTGLIGWAVKLGIDRIKNGLVKSGARRIVRFVAQRMDGQPNDAKLELAAGRLSEKFPYLSKEEVQQFIEEAVVDLKNQLKEI